MDLQKQIQTLKVVLNSQREVARHLGINRETVARYWNETIPTSFNSLPPPKWSEQIDWEYFNKEINNGVSVKTLYKEFSQFLKLPAYENVARYYRTHFNSEKKIDVSLKIDRIPGHSLEVEFPKNL